MKDEHNHHGRPYGKVLIILGVVTLIEIFVGIAMDAGGDGTVYGLKLFVLMMIAIFKVVMIVAFYMHIKYETRPFLLAAIVFIFPLLIITPIALFPAFT
jgi:caa(3)-type oxidase subunit IV